MNSIVNDCEFIIPMSLFFYFLPCVVIPEFYYLCFYSPFSQSSPFVTCHRVFYLSFNLLNRRVFSISAL